MLVVALVETTTFDSLEVVRAGVLNRQSLRTTLGRAAEVAIWTLSFALRGGSWGDLHSKLGLIVPHCGLAAGVEASIRDDN